MTAAADGIGSVTLVTSGDMFHAGTKYFWALRSCALWTQSDGTPVVSPAFM